MMITLNCPVQADSLIIDEDDVAENSQIIDAVLRANTLLDCYVMMDRIRDCNALDQLIELIDELPTPIMLMILRTIETKIMTRAEAIHKAAKE